MRKRHLLLTIIAMLIITVFSSCSKEEATVAYDEVTYEVIPVGTSAWSGTYLNENAVLTGVNGNSNSWKYTFKNSKNLCCGWLAAKPDVDNTSSYCYMRIYVNGILISSGKSTTSANIYCDLED